MIAEKYKRRFWRWRENRNADTWPGISWRWYYTPEMQAWVRETLLQLGCPLPDPKEPYM